MIIKTVKRILSLLLIALLSISAAVPATTSAEAAPPPAGSSAETKRGINEVALRHLLKNRSYVTDTLLGDHFSQNDPNAYANDVHGSAFLYTEILDNYKNNPTYSSLVDVWYRAANLGETIFAIPADLADVFLTQESWTAFLKNADNTAYNAVLLGALKSSYISQSGTTLEDDSTRLQLVREWNEANDTIAGKLSDISSLTGLITDVNSAYQAEYVKSVLPDYGVSLQEYLSSLESLYDQAEYTSFSEESNQKMLATADMYDVVNYSRFGYDEDEYKAWRFSSDLELFAANVSAAIGAMDTTLELATGTLDGIVMLETLLDQNSSLCNVLDRSTNVISADDAYKRMANVYIEQASKLSSDDLSKIAMYAALNSAVSAGSAALSGAVVSTLQSAMTNAMVHTQSVNSLFSESASIAAASHAVSNIFLSLGLVKFGADACTGLTDTAKKIYELRALCEVTDIIEELYISDLRLYIEAENQETDKSYRDLCAKSVLDDLYMLKRLRLRGNEIAYKMTLNQTDNTVIGWLSAGSADAIESVYTRQQNALIDSLIYPLSNAPYDLTGQLTIYKDNTFGCIGILKKSDDSTFNVAELEYRLANGLTMQYGSSVICNTDCYIGPICAAGSIIINPGVELLTPELTLNYECTLSGDGELRIDSDFICTKSCTIDCKVEVGGDFVHKGYDRINGPTGNVPAHLTMQDDAALLIVHGDFYAQAATTKISSTTSLLTAGTLCLDGNLYKDSVKNYNSFSISPTGTFTVELCGSDKPQIISNLSDKDLILNRLKLSNPKGILLSGETLLYSLQSDLVIHGNLSGLRIVTWNDHTLYVKGSTADPVLGLNLPEGYQKIQTRYVENQTTYLNTRYLPGGVSTIHDTTVSLDSLGRNFVSGNVIARDSSVTVLCARFDTNMRMIDCRLVSLPASEELQPWSFTFDAVQDPDRIMLFLLDTAWSPLASVLYADS